MRVLVISAHPDDETIGAGGTILRHIAAGDEVFWAVVTKGHTPQWSDEVIEKARRQVEVVGKMYGFSKIFSLGFPTVRLNTVPNSELTNALQKVVDEVRPNVVYTTPANDINQDHRIVFDATLVATRPMPGSTVERVLSYEIGTTSGYGQPSGSMGFRPTVFVDVSAFLARKLEIMKVYQTELKDFPHPRSVEGLEVIAKSRGLSVGLAAAESFELVREIFLAK